MGILRLHSILVLPGARINKLNILINDGKFIYRTKFIEATIFRYSSSAYRHTKKKLESKSFPLVPQSMQYKSLWIELKAFSGAALPSVLPFVLLCWQTHLQFFTPPLIFEMHRTRVYIYKFPYTCSKCMCSLFNAHSKSSQKLYAI